MRAASLFPSGPGFTSSARLLANKLLFHMRESACVLRNSTHFRLQARSSFKLTLLAVVVNFLCDSLSGCAGAVQKI